MMPVPHCDVSSQGNPRPTCHSLDAAGALGLLLHYQNSTMWEISLQQIFAIIPTTVSRYIDFGLYILLQTLRTMPEAAIEWPAVQKSFEENNALIVAHHPRLTGAFTSIDGLNLAVQTSEDEDVENATYNGWLGEHFVSSVLVFSLKGLALLSENVIMITELHLTGLIIAANLNAPGSWSNCWVPQPIYEKLRTQTPPSFYLVAETAFPRGTNQIQGRIQAPIKAGQRIRGTAEEIEERLAFD